MKSSLKPSTHIQIISYVRLWPVSETPGLLVRLLVNMENLFGSLSIFLTITRDNFHLENQFKKLLKQSKIFQIWLLFCSTAANQRLLLRVLKNSKNYSRELIQYGGYGNGVDKTKPATMTRYYRNDLSPPMYYETYVKNWIEESGATVIGGCCGIFPEHIKYAHDRIRGILTEAQKERTFSIVDPGIVNSYM